MATDKKIAILMAVYDPHMDWLREQLNSLNTQTYPNLQLYIRDDCSPTVPYEDIKACVAECITDIPYTITRNEKNVGSNLTFQKLTEEAEADYFAYCDQDDIWLSEKLARYMDTALAENAELVCSDMYIIDGQGKMVADSITKTRRHHIFRSGTGLSDTLWYSNFASGCALLVRAETAKAAIPFNPHMFYDHYITLWASVSGYIGFIPASLIYHREHGNNQSGGMPGVYDRKSYIKERVEVVKEAVSWNRKNLPQDERLKNILATGEQWMEARLYYLRGEHSYRKMIWQHRHFSPMASLFEIVSPWLPDKVFMMFIELVKHNIV